MNYSDMATHLAGSVLRRGTGGETLLLAKQAILQAQLQIQRAWDWPCMKGHSFSTFREDGIMLPLDLRRLNEVHTVSASNVKETYLLPSNLDLNQELAVNSTVATLPTSTARWWVEEGRLFIGPALAAGTKVRLDFYRLLPAYVNDSDEDWFARWAWDAVVYRAAQLGSLSLWQDDRVAMFQALADEYTAEARRVASEGEYGGTAHHVRPPLRGGRLG